VKSSSVVVTATMDTGANRAFEFLLAVVDERGVLHQYCGTDPEIADELEEIAETGTSRALALLRTAKSQEAATARERGDTPEMPRHTEGLTPKPRRVDGPGPQIAPAVHVSDPEVPA
jgi:hypothetical protein